MKPTIRKLFGYLWILTFETNIGYIYQVPFATWADALSILRGFYKRKQVKWPKTTSSNF